MARTDIRSELPLLCIDCLRAATRCSLSLHCRTLQHQRLRVRRLLHRVLLHPLRARAELARAPPRRGGVPREDAGRTIRPRSRHEPGDTNAGAETDGVSPGSSLIPFSAHFILLCTNEQLLSVHTTSSARFVTLRIPFRPSCSLIAIRRCQVLSLHLKSRFTLKSPCSSRVFCRLKGIGAAGAHLGTTAARDEGIETSTTAGPAY